MIADGLIWPCCEKEILIIISSLIFSDLLTVVFIGTPRALIIPTLVPTEGN